MTCNLKFYGTYDTVRTFDTNWLLGVSARFLSHTMELGLNVKKKDPIS